MKIFYCANVLAVLFYSYSGFASILDNNTHLVAQIKTNPTTSGSKPTSQYIKLAHVSFLPEFSPTNVSFGCPDGYTRKDGVCEENACDGFPYNNLAQTANCEQYEACQSGAGYKYRCQSCAEGLTASSGRCSCDTKAYPYGDSSPCVFAYDEDNKCTEVSANGDKKTYYAGCLCPDNWLSCNGNHEKGMGTACESYGKKSYYNCGCESDYNKTCLTSRPVSSTDYCLNLTDGIRYYKECYSCELAKGEVYSYDEYWCNHQWVDFPVIGDLFAQ